MKIHSKIFDGIILIYLVTILNFLNIFIHLKSIVLFYLIVLIIHNFISPLLENFFLETYDKTQNDNKFGIFVLLIGCILFVVTFFLCYLKL